MKLFISVIFLASSIIIPFYFNPILIFLVTKIGFGWVVGTIVIRILVIFLFALFLHLLLKMILKTRQIKFIWIFLIALLPGFGISFISPIYSVDYGMFNDELKLENYQDLNAHLNSNILPEHGYSLCAFFTTSCPHCMNASEKLGINIDAGQSIPVNVFFPGSIDDAKMFLTKNNGEKFNMHLIDNDSLFVNLSGGAFPSIFVIDSKGKTKYHWTGDEMNYSALDWLRNN